MRNIAEEIAERSGNHAMKPGLKQIENSNEELAETLATSVGFPAFHTIVVHHEDKLRIQLEDRFVDTRIVPDYLDQDFMTTTPNAILTAATPISKAEQSVEAVLPQSWECKLLTYPATNLACRCDAGPGPERRSSLLFDCIFQEVAISSKVSSEPAFRDRSRAAHVKPANPLWRVGAQDVRQH